MQTALSHGSQAAVLVFEHHALTKSILLIPEDGDLRDVVERSRREAHIAPTVPAADWIIGSLGYQAGRITTLPGWTITPHQVDMEALPRLGIEESDGFASAAKALDVVVPQIWPTEANVADEPGSDLDTATY